MCIILSESVGPKHRYIFEEYKVKYEKDSLSKSHVSLLLTISCTLVLVWCKQGYAIRDNNPTMCFIKNEIDT